MIIQRTGKPRSFTRNQTDPIHHSIQRTIKSSAIQIKFIMIRRLKILIVVNKIIQISINLKSYNYLIDLFHPDPYPVNPDSVYPGVKPDSTSRLD
ncbi:hypothetical protein NPIL_700111 [Nephila pilipes]|uniref:Uncharacterized protein n=1 Tax=Nephila pilipes TaxID=299642 RepID=A0A8X6NCS0_NEPPI|nr:hypothetical protein NPIL_700111 [Nephila pilipes]